MTVTVDIGNTNIVMGFWENDAPKVFRFETSVSGTYNEYYAAIKPALLEVFPQLRNGVPDLLSEQKISGVKWGISSVVPSLTGIIEQILRCFFSREPVVLNKELFMRPDFPVKVPDSAVDEIGTDIICDAFGALERGGRSVIVDFGTALTITAVDFDGTIKGVSIAPGIKTAVKSLFDNTAQLPPDIPLVYPESVLGTDTFSAIQSGVLFGYGGLIKEIVSEMKNELDRGSSRPCFVVATGGLSSLVAPHVKIFDSIDGNLTLRGLKNIVTKYGQP